MIIEQLMPALSPTMEEGTIANWTVKPGDKISAGQVIAEVQTDKTVVEWETLDDGYLREIVIPSGEEAKVNMVAALVSTDKDEAIDEALDQARAKNQELAGGGEQAADEDPDEASEDDDDEDDEDDGKAAPKSSKPSKPSKSSKPAPKPAAAKPAPSPRAETGNVRISPVAARIAQTNGLDLSGVRGSGTDGRIVRRDVEAALASGGGGTRAHNPFLGQRQDQDLAVTQMRQIIGRRLLESKQQIPHFYITERIDAAALVALRAQLNAVEGVKITFNDLVVKAVALCLVRHPAVNATFHGDVIRQYGSADISIAVAIPDGLITPILRGAEGLTLSQINAGVKDLAGRAQSGQLAPDEYQGGSFTISNLGMYGIEDFAAIINPPQAAILAIGGIKDEPVVRDGAVVAGKTLRLTLSADHRVVDGAVGAAFVKDLRELLENPAALML